MDAAIFEGEVILRTNAKNPRFQVLATDVEHLSPADWKEIIPEQDGGVIEATWIVGREIAVLTSKRAVSSLALHDLDGKKLRDVPLPSLGTVTGLNGEWDGDELFIRSSLFSTRRPSFGSTSTRENRP